MRRLGTSPTLQTTHTPSPHTIARPDIPQFRRAAHNAPAHAPPPIIITQPPPAPEALRQCAAGAARAPVILRALMDLDTKNGDDLETIRLRLTEATAWFETLGQRPDSGFPRSAFLSPSHLQTNRRLVVHVVADAREWWLKKN